MEKLLCRLDAQSPVLSDAEVSMEQEVGQLMPKLQAISHRIEEVRHKWWSVSFTSLLFQAKGKLRLGYGEAAGVERVKMSKAQDETICAILEDS